MTNLSQEEHKYEFGFATDPGRKRKGWPNQDALEVVVPTATDRWHPPLLIIADGMGGHVGGTTASQLVVQTFKHEFTRATHPTQYLQLMEECAQKAHKAVRLRGATDAKLANMGSTLVAAVMEENMCHLLNVGDSRAYILRGENINQISQDQSWVAAQVQAGILTEQQARSHPKRNRLSMAITAGRREIATYKISETIYPEDIWVLCSDGLWGVVPETLIWAAANELSPQVAAKKLVALANNSSGPDNISVIIVRRFSSSHRLTPTSVEDTSP